MVEEFVEAVLMEHRSVHPSLNDRFNESMLAI